MNRLVDRPRHVEWKLWRDEGGFANEEVTQAILLDIREHLKTLVTIFQCSNAQAIPGILREIALHTHREIALHTQPKKRTKKRRA